MKTNVIFMHKFSFGLEIFLINQPMIPHLKMIIPAASDKHFTVFWVIFERKDSLSMTGSDLVRADITVTLIAMLNLEHM